MVLRGPRTSAARPAGMLESIPIPAPMVSARPTCSAGMSMDLVKYSTEIDMMMPCAVVFARLLIAQDSHQPGGRDQVTQN